MKHLDDETMVCSKSSFSTGSANYVEITTPEDVAAIRDTKHRNLGTLTFDQSEWHAFLNTTKGYQR